MTFFGPSMMEKTMVEARARKISGGPDYVGGRGPSDARFSRTHTRVGARPWALTEPERGIRLTEPERLHYRLRVTEPKRSIDPLLLTEPK